jgi:hypothetical protein
MLKPVWAAVEYSPWSRSVEVRMATLDLTPEQANDRKDEATKWRKELEAAKARK